MKALHADIKKAGDITHPFIQVKVKWKISTTLNIYWNIHKQTASFAERYLSNMIREPNNMFYMWRIKGISKKQKSRKLTHSHMHMFLISWAKSKGLLYSLSKGATMKD